MPDITASEDKDITAKLSTEQWSDKVEEINAVLSEADVDLWKLRELALSDGGLVNGKFQC